MSDANPELGAPATPAEMGELLTSLRDLHEPAPISGWPPAPGWWVLLALCVLTGAYLIWRQYQRRAPIRVGQQAVVAALHRWQEHKNDSRYLTEVNTTLRRLALTVKPRRDVAPLTGTRWVSTLNSLSSHRLTDQSASALSEQAYRPDPQTRIESLHTDVLRWLKRFKESGHA